MNGNIVIKSLDLDGAIVMNVGSRGNVFIEQLTVKNKGMSIIPIKPENLKFADIDYDN